MRTQGRILAACGNDCAACPRFIASSTGTADDLRQVAELWHRLGWRAGVVSVEEIKCSGCSATQPCRYEIVACADERRVETCGGCREYCTCGRLAKALERTDEAAHACETLVAEATYAALHRAFFRKRENLVATRTNTRVQTAVSLE